MVIKEIIKKEIRENIATLKYLFLAGGIVVLFVLNALVSISDYQERINHYEGIRSAVKNQRKQRCNNFSDLVYHRFRLIKKPSSEAFISHAQADKLPNGIKMDFFELSNPQYFKPLNIYSKSFITLDWSNILFYILSFLCLSLSYNAFSGERINRTLQLMLSNQLPRAYIIVGKYLGLLSLISIPVVIGILLNLIIYQLSPQMPLKDEIPGLTFLFFLGMLLFISLNLLVGFLISSLTRQPVISMSFCLIAWLVFAVVIPGTGWLWSKQVINIQSVHSIQDKIERKSDELLLSDQYNLRWNSDWIGKPVNETLKKRINYFQKLQEIKNRLWQRHIERQFRQTDLAILIAKISPYGIFRFFGETISDNGYTGYKHFYHQVREYHNQYTKFLIEKDKADKDSYHQIWNMQHHAKHWMSSKPVEYQAIPKFSYERPDISQTWREVKGNIIYLLFWCIFLLVGTFIAFIRYDVR